MHGPASESVRLAAMVAVVGAAVWAGRPSAAEPPARLHDRPCDLRVESELFAAGGDEPVARSLTLFHNGVAWDFLELMDGETTAATIGEIDGIRLLSPAVLDDLRRPRSEGPDRILLLPTAFGTGFMLPPSLCLAGAPGSFGHPGAGGSLGYAEPETGLALGYVMNRMNVGAALDPRAHSLVEAARASL